MSFILILNCGSATVKYSLFESKDLNLINKGIKEKIGLKGLNHKQAIKEILKDLEVKNRSQIKAVGHRVVHGGNLKQATVIDEKVINQIEELSKLAPLHNPYNVLGIKICKNLLPKPKQVAVFDTAFFTSLKPSSYVYPIPYSFFEEQRIRRYGFHGISHQYLMEETQRILGKAGRLITCHLGGGSSITAIKNNRPINTSMGFTPLEGLVMETRSGDIDPAIPTYLIQELGFEAEQVYNILNKKSGLKGICGKKDFRDILKLKEENEKVNLAYNIFCLRLTEYIGSYAAQLKGLDAIVFSAGIGENSWELRKDVMNHFKFMGVKLDKKKNKENSQIISSKGSKVKVLVISTNEELKIAQETQELI